MKVTDRFNDFDYLYIGPQSSEHKKSLTVHWYDVKINNETRFFEKIEKQINYNEYTHQRSIYYFAGRRLLESFESNTKDKDKITVTMNITVITNEKEETKTIERNFITKERKVFALYSF
jgi:hypothetical protein